jgi:3-oxoacyl-[acyl-carrier protein] reductase
MKSLNGKVALVTGAGRGIGKAVALALAKEGCRVILTARSTAQLEHVNKEIMQSGGSAAIVPADLARDDDIERLAQESGRAYGPVDILINNAGWGKRASVVRTKIEDLDQTLRVNLRAPVLLAKYLVPPMIEKGDGAVINIGSVSGKSGEANGAAYSASKFGLIVYSVALRGSSGAQHQSERDPAGFRRHAADSAEQATGSQQDDSSRGRSGVRAFRPHFAADLLSSGNHDPAAENAVPVRLCLSAELLQKWQRYFFEALDHRVCVTEKLRRV